MADREVISNAVENISIRLAEKNKGLITSDSVLPYLPVSLELVSEILSETAAESKAITPERVAGINHFCFDLSEARESDPSSLRVTHCVSCDQDVEPGGETVLCPDCSEELADSLKTEAETSGWPAQAVYQHEIFYLAAQIKAPVSAEKLASRSRLTVRRMRRKLNALATAGFISESGGQYTFPPLRYPREKYLSNIQFIRALPASITEEVEVRIVHIITALGVLFLLMLGLAFCAIPFPILLTGFLITAPLMSLLIWKHRSKIDSKEVD